MKKFYFTPGPSQLYFTANEHLKSALKKDIPSISHRSATFQKIVEEVTENLKIMFNLGDHHDVFFMSSANEIWERIIENTVQSESFHLVNGAFSNRFRKIATELGVNALSAEAEYGKVVDIEKLLVPESVELMAITQNETSTGASQPVDDIYSLRSAFPNQLLAVDMVSSAPYVNIDFEKVDTAYFSVQKCFGLPAGLGVWITNDKCIEACHRKLDKGKSIGSYHSLPVLKEKAVKNQTPETPNVLALYLLNGVVKDMLTKGLDMIRRETDYKAAVLYHAVNDSEVLEPFVADDRHKSKTTIVAKSHIGSAPVIDSFAKRGLILGAGYGDFKNDHLRIANFPTHSKEHIEYIADELIKIRQ
ncbi:MAG: aminotransferase class V-fold PLP-dependent enzyme [Bacteroidota bacterium]